MCGRVMIVVPSNIKDNCGEIPDNRNGHQDQGHNEEDNALRLGQFLQRVVQHGYRRPTPPIRSL